VIALWSSFARAWARVTLGRFDSKWAWRKLLREDAALHEGASEPYARTATEVMEHLPDVGTRCKMRGTNELVLGPPTTQSEFRLAFGSRTGSGLRYDWLTSRPHDVRA
jgi:hypothetical protein